MKVTLEVLRERIARVDNYAQEHKVSTAQACDRLKVHKSAYYHWRYRLKGEAKGKVKVITHDVPKPVVAAKPAFRAAPLMTLVAGTPEQIAAFYRELNGR